MIKKLIFVLLLFIGMGLMSNTSDAYPRRYSTYRYNSSYSSGGYGILYLHPQTGYYGAYYRSYGGRQHYRSYRGYRGW